MTTLTLALLLAAPLAAEEPPVNNMDKKPQGRFTICLAPHGCGSSGRGMLRRPPAGYNPDSGEIEKPKKGEPLRDAPADTAYYTSLDPLAKKARGETITSAIRLDAEDTGNDAQVLVIQSEPDLALPKSAVPKAPQSRTDAPAGEWAPELAGEGEAAGQVNLMRGEREGIAGSSGEATTAGRRMYGERRTP